MEASLRRHISTYQHPEKASTTVRMTTPTTVKEHV